MIHDPIPDPIAAGWIKEGDEPHLPTSTGLRINDTTNAGFARFYVEDTAAFDDEIVLSPSVILADGFSADAEDSTGVHVSINDGDREIRAALLRTPAGAVKVAIKLVLGYSSGFVFPSTSATFQLKRLADGSAVLAVAGQPVETIRRFDLALSRRLGVKTIEFGADSRSGVVTTEWFTLGLPSLARPIPFARLTISRLQLRVRA